LQLSVKSAKSHYSGCFSDFFFVLSTQLQASSLMFLTGFKDLKS